MSTALTPSNDYRFPPEPAPAILTRAIWDAVLGSVAERLRALEAQRTDLEDLINDLSFNGQARIDAAITPLIDAQKKELSDLRAALAVTVGENDKVIVELRARVDAELKKIGDDIDRLQARVDTILAGGVPADDVAETADRVFVTPEQRTKIWEVDDKAPIASPTFTGTPKAPYPSLNDTGNEIAIAGWVKGLLANGVNYGSGWTVPTAALGDSDNSPASTAFVQAATQAAASALEQQARLNALLIAELRGDRLNMVDGIVDPYTDASDVAGTSANIVPGGGLIRPRIAGTGGNIASTANTSAINVGSGGIESVFDNNANTSIAMQRLAGQFQRDAGAGNKALVGEVSIRNENSNRTPGTLFVDVSDDAASWTSIGSFGLNRGASALNTFSTLANDRKRYLRIYATGDIPGDQSWGVAELVVREGVRTAMDLRSVSFASDIASPKTARLAVQVAPMLDGASLQVNADLISSVSRNGGATWTAVSLQAIETLADGTTLFEGLADISGQPAGSSMVYRHVTANAKDVRISGTIFQWRA